MRIHRQHKLKKQAWHVGGRTPDENCQAGRQQKQERYGHPSLAVQVLPQSQPIQCPVGAGDAKCRFSTRSGDVPCRPSRRS